VTVSELSERATRLFNKPDAEWDADDCLELDSVLDEIDALEAERLALMRHLDAANLRERRLESERDRLMERVEELERARKWSRESPRFYSDSNADAELKGGEE